MNDADQTPFFKLSATAWAGLDVAKATFDAALYFGLEPDARPRSLKDLPTASFPRNPEGVGAFCAWADEQLRKHCERRSLPEAPPLRALMEATGRYSIELSAWLVEARPQLRPAIVDPKAVHDFIKSLRVRNITDRIAARALSRFGFERKPEPQAPHAPEFAELRELSRQRDFIVQTLVAARNRALENTPSKTSATIQKQMIRNLEKSLERIEKAISKHIAKHSEIAKTVQRLQTIPGVGLWTSVVVLAELGDITRFKRSRQLGAFAGLSPRQHDSGTSVRKRPRLCKQGSTRVRQGLYLSALAAIRKDTTMHRFYLNLVENHKPKMVAIGAVMRKQLILMRSLLLNGTDYQNDYVTQRDHSRTPDPQESCA
jgi:transposase